jgi:hypothetical protein
MYHLFYVFSRPVTKSFLGSSLRDPSALRTHSGFCTSVKTFHWPHLYYVNAPNYSYNTYAFLEAGRVEDSFVDFESNTMERLRDGQFKLGATRYENYAGSQ